MYFEKQIIYDLSYLSSVLYKMGDYNINENKDQNCFHLDIIDGLSYFIFLNTEDTQVLDMIIVTNKLLSLVLDGNDKDTISLFVKNINNDILKFVINIILFINTPR